MHTKSVDASTFGSTTRESGHAYQRNLQDQSQQLSMTIVPYEICSQIVEEIGDDRPTLHSLRLVSRTASGAATPRIFYTITTWLAEHQQERLDKIASHPQLRLLVKRIVFRPWKIRYVGLCTESDYLHVIWKNDDTLKLHIPVGHLSFENFEDRAQAAAKQPMPYPKSSLERGYKIQVQAYESQQDREEDGSDILDLARAIEAFSNLAHVTFADEKSTAESSLLTRLTRIPPSLARDHCYPVYVMLYTLKLAKTCLHRLNVHTLTASTEAITEKYLLRYARRIRLHSFSDIRVVEVGLWFSRKGVALLNQVCPKLACGIDIFSLFPTSPFCGKRRHTSKPPHEYFSHLLSPRASYFFNPPSELHEAGDEHPKPGWRPQPGERWWNGRVGLLLGGCGQEFPDLDDGVGSGEGEGA
ncbi:hypothetical protein MMC30_008932 [Trapelia coarctata]|nr:hypothetical protein [Trapelia coarctata]